MFDFHFRFVCLIWQVNCVHRVSLKYLLAPRLCADFDRTRAALRRIECDWSSKECGSSNCAFGNCVQQFTSKQARAKVDAWREAWSCLTLPERHECIMRYYDRYGDYSTADVYDDVDDFDYEVVTLKHHDGREITGAVDAARAKKVVVKQYRSACSWESDLACEWKVWHDELHHVIVIDQFKLWY